LCLSLLCPLYAAPCPAAQTKDEAALLRIEHRWAQALEKHDAAMLERILADDFEEAEPDGQLFDRSVGAQFGDEREKHQPQRARRITKVFKCMSISFL
jgi:hypothetical protein